MLSITTFSLTSLIANPQEIWRQKTHHMNNPVSILAEIPAELHESLQHYLENHPNWDQDRVFAAALSLFFLQNGDDQTTKASQNYRACTRVYLETLFQQS